MTYQLAARHRMTNRHRLTNRLRLTNRDRLTNRQCMLMWFRRSPAARGSRFRVAIVVCALAPLLWAGRARADDEADQARAYHEKAKAAFALSHYGQAAEFFEKAFELKSDPAYGWLMLAPLEVIGVDRFEPSAVIISIRIKTSPAQQWTVGREFNRRMKKAFDAKGISMPSTHHTLYFGADPGDQPSPIRVAVETPPQQEKPKDS